MAFRKAVTPKPLPYVQYLPFPTKMTTPPADAADYIAMEDWPALSLSTARRSRTSAAIRALGYSSVI